MAKVIKHQSKDGTLHNSARECDANDRKLRIAPAMEKLVSGLGAEAPGLTRSEDGTAFHVDLTDLSKFLAEHAEKIRDAITDALTIRKPRKPKAPASSAA
ncbi:MAG: hypothetical protein WKG03_03715 [Telluria sp.]